MPTSTIRYYERRGLLEAPEREGGRRRYGAEAADVLALIAAAKEAGFSLDEVDQLLHGFEPKTPPSERWRRMAKAKLEDLDRRMAELEQMRALLRRGVDCGCLRVADCDLLRERLRDRTSAA